MKGRQDMWVGVLSGLVVLALAAGTGYGAAAADPSEYIGIGPAGCEFGGDIRIRQVHFDNIPPRPENHFFRFRTRLWGAAHFGEDVCVHARIVNEFRDYRDPDTDAWEFPDEGIVDNLFVEVRDVIDDLLDLRIGRQDLVYGRGRVLLDGTPLDGSRTIYCDAVKATFKGIESTTVDLLGIYNEADAELLIDSQDRNLTGLAPWNEEYAESGGGMYVKNDAMADLPFEAYYFYKNEEAHLNDLRSTNPVEVAEADVHTVGVRLMPALADGVKGNLEAAYQMGEQGDVDLEGMMVDAAVSWMVPVMEDMKPCLGAGVYYLSGDDPDTADNEGWNPLWARWPQYSELYVYAWDAEGGAGRWSNIMMPHADLSLAPAKAVKANLLVGQMYAAEGDGPGGGDERGLLVTLRTDFTLGQDLLLKKDKLFGHLLAEIVDPGDFHADDELMHFLRWELSYAF